MNNPTLAEIRRLLETFQDGYTRRDVSQVDSFLDLFLPEIEMVGTNGVRPGVDEWYLTRAAARELVEGDWQHWDDLQLDLENASIHARGETGWVAGQATVTQRIGEDNYAGFLEFAKEFIDKSPLTAEQKLLYLLRDGTNTLYELRLGERFVWPLRFTAVVVHAPDGWKFAQIHFSFPTLYFPDLRVLDQPPLPGL